MDNYSKMDNFRKMIHRACTETDFSDKEEAIRLTKWLAHEVITYRTVAGMYEDKLSEVMSAKEYREFTKDSAIKLFRQDINGMEESDFKDFALEHFEEIVSDVPVSELIENYKREHGDGDEVS